MPRPFLPLTLAQFEQLVDFTPLTRRIDSVHMHHTWRPNHAQYRGLRSIESMWEYHTRENGWSDIAQHISIGPEGTIWTGRDWNRPPASATGFNGSETSGPFMFEIIGDFDRGADPLVGTQLQAVLGVIAALMKKHGLALQSLRFHNEMTDAKSCPGSSLDKDTILKGVAALLSKPAAKPAVPRAPSADPLIADARALVAAAIPRTARTGEDSSAGLDCHIDYPSWELASKLGSRSGESPDFQSLRPHLVNLRHGKYSNDGQVGTTAADIDALFKQHLPDAISRLPAGSKLPLMLYAHGGLVKEKVALAGAAAQIPWWNANGVYPLFFIWETGLLETLGQMIEAALGSFWKRLGGGRSLDTLPRGDLFIDPAVEKAARRIGGVKIWGAMKESARKAFSQGGDGLHFIRALADFLKSHGNQVSLQAIGHSAGSIWHAYLIDALLNRRPANDLDALFWQGRDRSCAQNLVVSTAFGLSLDGTLQGSIPPFRSSVQTSTYLAVLQAIRFGPNNLKNDPASKLRWPRRDVEIYEIGRKGPHLLAFWNHQDHSLQGVSPGRVAITGPKRIEQGVHLLVIGLSALVLSACIWFTTRFNRRIWKGRQFRWIPRISQAVVLTAAGIWLWYGWRSPEAHELATAEPRVWLSGISGIPVIIGNTMSVALASTLLFLGIRRLALNMREVKNAYPFGGYRSGDRRQPHEIRAYRSHGFLRYPSPWDITGWLVILSHARPPHFRALAKRLGKPFGRHRKADYDSAAPLLQQQRIVHFLGRSPESRLVDSFAREGLATSLSNRLIRILVGLVALLTLYRVLSGSQLPNTLAPPFLRGAGERTAFQYSDMAAKIALVVSCCFVIDTQLRLGLSLAKFGRFLRDRGTRKSSPYLHGHRMDLPDDLLPERPRLSGWLSPLKPFDDPRDIGLWELPLVEIAASRFRASAPAVGIPFTLLFILLVTRYSVFEGVSYPAGEMIFFVTAMSLPLITGAFAQFQMRAIFVAASARLRRAKAIHTGKIEAFCGNEIDSLAKLRADTIYLPTENPLLRAILLPLGGIGILELANGIAPYLK